MGPIQSFDEFLGLLLRRRLLIAAVSVTVTVLVVMYALSRPVIYEAVAVIQVESPVITDATGVVVATGSAQRIQTIEQRLTTREAILALIERHGLLAGLPLSNDQKVYVVRNAVRFQPVASAAQGGFGAPAQVSALLIFAQADSAETSARIANDLAQGVLDSSVAGQASRAREANDFFTEEETRLNAAIGTLEAEIAAFRNANADSLPDLREARRDEVISIEAEIRTIDQTLVDRANSAARIGKGRALRDSEVQEIAAINAEVAVLQRQKADMSARRDHLVAALTRTPEVEQALGVYARQLGQLKDEFSVVTRRRTEANTTQKIEERQQAERFTLLERAVAPEYPITGGRRKIAMAGAVASVILGIAAAFALDLLNPALRTRTQFERDLGLRPVVAIPDLTHLRRPRRRPGIPARPVADVQGLWQRLTASRMGQAALALPRPILGLGAALAFLAMAVVIA